MTSNTPPTPNNPEQEELDAILAGLVQYHKQLWRVSGVHQDIQLLDLPDAKAALTAWSNKRLLAELQALSELPNVYPQKIGGQFTHVEAIFKSAVTDRIAALKQKL